MFSPNIEYPNSEKEGSIRMGIYFVPKTSPIPVTWDAYLFAYGAFCQIDIDNFGQIKKIKYQYIYE